MVIGIGSIVRCKTPFDQGIEGLRTVVGQSAETRAWQIINDEGAQTDFDASNLEEVIE